MFFEMYQGDINKKLIAYLSKISVASPEEYDKEAVADLLIAIKKGGCHGYAVLISTSLWISKTSTSEKKFRHDFTWCKNTINLLKNWDENLSSLTAENKRNIDDFLSLLNLIQNESKHFFLNSFPLERPINLLEINAHSSVKDSGILHRKNTYELTAVFTEENFVKVLNKLNPMEDIFTISCKINNTTNTYHAISFLKINDVYFFVDSNIGIKTTKILNELAGFILEYYVLNSTPWDTFDIIIEASSFIEEPRNIYPNKKTILENHAEKKYGLHTAAWFNCLESIDFLLENKQADINEISPLGFLTPLATATGYGHIEIVKRFLAMENIEYNKAGKLGQTPLMIACEYNQIEIVKLLLAKTGILYNQAMHSGETALYLACENGYTEIVELLLKQENIDFNKSAKGVTPLYIAYFNEHPDIVQLLLAINTKVEKITFDQFIEKINYVSNPLSKTFIKEEFIKNIKYLSLNDLAKLAKIMRTIQEENITLEQSTQTNPHKSLIFLRRERGFFQITGAYGNTQTWQAVMTALKEQIKIQLQIALISKEKQMPASQETIVIDFLKFQHKRIALTASTENHDWIDMTYEPAASKLRMC
jgi:ankyrin repeat protein